MPCTIEVNQQMLETQHLLFILFVGPFKSIGVFTCECCPQDHRHKRRTTLHMFLRLHLNRQVLFPSQLYSIWVFQQDLNQMHFHLRCTTCIALIQKHFPVAHQCNTHKLCFGAYLWTFAKNTVQKEPPTVGRWGLSKALNQIYSNLRTNCTSLYPLSSVWCQSVLQTCANSYKVSIGTLTCTCGMKRKTPVDNDIKPWVSSASYWSQMLGKVRKASNEQF